MMRTVALLSLSGLTILAIAVGSMRPRVSAQETATTQSSAVAPAPADAALERTRKQVRMLDDIYKGGIVIITKNYVNDESTIPAGTAFKQLFQAAEEKGWHRVRLLDATGEPYNDENAPNSRFEKDAVKALAAGKKHYERIVEKDGKRYLQVATPIPVVFEKCIMCHDNYADVPAGKPIGAMAYTVPIE